VADVIQQLRELRQSSASSVVTGIELTPSEARPSIAHPLQAWLIDLILDQLTAPASPALSLIVLSGNAGDGKSYLLREIRQRLRAEEGVDPWMINWLLDATESRRQTEQWVERLADFFAPFGDEGDWRAVPLHVIAMNTGTAVRFIHDPKRSDRLKTLCDILQLQLAIATRPEVDVTPTYWERFDRVLVIDLDRRMLVPLAEEEESFLDHMLSTLDRGRPSSFLATAATDCATCPVASRCPVHVNLLALQLPVVRERLNTLLRDVALEDRMHIGPRSLWHAVYQMTIGGLDAAAIKARRPLPACPDMATIDDTTRAQALFFTALFDTRDDTDPDAPTLFPELRQIDPAYRFTLETHETALEASLSPGEDQQLCESFAAALGVPADALAGDPANADKRAAAAVRRAFFLQRSDPDPERHAWLRAWSQNLAEYRRAILNGQTIKHDSVDFLISVLKEIYRVDRSDSLWHFKLPWRHGATLFTNVTLRPGNASAKQDPRVLGPDAARHELRAMVRELSTKLDAYPLSVSVPLRDGQNPGPDVRMTWPLFRLLQNVKHGHYVAASLDPERVQNLDRVGASLGAQAIKKAVIVEAADGRWICETDGNGGYLVSRL
jgi:hypothetical protein